MSDTNDDWASREIGRLRLELSGEKALHECTAADAQRIIDALTTENERLRAQLPESMQACTIRFRECPVGHGWLTADNWAQHGCQVCARTAAEARLAEATALLKVAKDGMYDDLEAEIRSFLANQPAAPVCSNTEAFLSGDNTGCDGVDCPVHKHGQPAAPDLSRFDDVRAEPSCYAEQIGLSPVSPKEAAVALLEKFASLDTRCLPMAVVYLVADALRLLASQPAAPTAVERGKALEGMGADALTALVFDDEPAAPTRTPELRPRCTTADYYEPVATFDAAVARAKELLGPDFERKHAAEQAVLDAWSALDRDVLRYWAARPSLDTCSAARAELARRGLN